MYRKTKGKEVEKMARQITTEGLFRLCSQRNALRRQAEADSLQYRVYMVKANGDLYANYQTSRGTFQEAYEEMVRLMVLNPHRSFKVVNTKTKVATQFGSGEVSDNNG